ncbi:MAG: hypothetical protein WCT49_04445 [Candidatus Paceibacterota bacterium]|jgi:hypothetical protein|nr:hypothetical protein [Candidatus Paceibacterota bacterium]
MKKLYFAHPINTYGTELEKELLVKITDAFPDWEIENPNQEKYRLGYEAWVKEHGRGMEYFYRQVLPGCAGCIVLPFRDGMWGAGVFGEARRFNECACPLWIITFDGNIKTAGIDPSLALSVKETVERIRDEEGRSKPF